MLFDLGWSEILLIGVVALVFIGPKDLPKAMRVAGYWIRKARTLSREFQGSIDQMLREAELDDVRQQLKKAAEFDLDREFHNTIDPDGSLREGLKPPELPSFPPPEQLPAPVIEGGAETRAAGEAVPSGATPAVPEPRSLPEPQSAVPASSEPAPTANEAHEPGSGQRAAVAAEIIPPRP